MKTIIVNVGKEVLTGKTVNTNLTFIAQQLKTIGIDVTRSFVIDDVISEYHKVLNIIDEDIIIFTGGLGPTIDDITRETVLDYYKCETYIDSEMLDTIKHYFDRLHIEMRHTNDKQALTTKEAVFIENKEGTAPGMYLKVKEKIIVLLPGPPSENKPMMKDVLRLLKSENDEILYSNGFKLVGTGESWMEQELIGFYEQHPNVNIAPYAGAGEIKYVFTSNNKTAMSNAMDAFSMKFSKFIYGDLEDTLEGVVVRLLKENNYIITTAESCTGGLLGGNITSVSGSSAVYNEGFITYSNESKVKNLGVPQAILDEHGAVSEACAFAMSDCLYNKTNANIAISVTGIAGPTGGSADKPVGLVYFGLTINGETQVYKRVFNGNRSKVRARAVIFALNLIRKKLIK